MGAWGEEGSREVNIYYYELIISSYLINEMWGSITHRYSFKKKMWWPASISLAPSINLLKTTNSYALPQIFLAIDAAISNEFTIENCLLIMHGI